MDTASNTASGFGGLSGEVWERARAERNWLLFLLQTEMRGDKEKLAKKPTFDGRNVVDRDKAAQRTFEEASAVASAQNMLAGAGRPGSLILGYFPRPGAAMYGLDFDNCLDPATGEVTDPEVAEIIAAGETYAEVSPSGTGVRMWMAPPAGDRATKRRVVHREGRAGMETSGLGGNAFTFTGRRLPGAPTQINPAPKAFAAVIGAADEAAPASIAEGRGAWVGPLDDTSAATVQAKLRAALESDATLSRRWAGGLDGIRDETRSGVDFAIIGGLKRAGLTFSEVVHCMLDEYPGESPAAERWRNGQERDMRRCFGRAGDATAEEEFDPVEIALAPVAGSDSIPAPFRAWVEKDLSRIPYPELFYSDFFARGYTSVTVAPPKVGKSRLGLAEAIDMTTGRGLLTGEPTEPVKVVYFNLEDEQDVIDNCVAAILTHYGIAQSEIAGRLFPTSGVGSEWHLIFGPDGTINERAFRGLGEFMKSEHVDLLIFDPLQDLSHSPETNEVFRALGRRLRAFASEYHVSVHLIHHTRKPQNGASPGMDDMRGGGALRGTARFNRILAPMDEADAAKAGVDDHRRYFRIAESESNLAPPSSSRNRWFEKKSVLTPSGHYIGVVVPWQWPHASEGVTEDHAAQVRAAIDRMPEPPMSRMQSPNWVGYLIGRTIGFDTSVASGKERAKQITADWIRRGFLTVESRRVKSGRRESEVIIPGPTEPFAPVSVL